MNTTADTRPVADTADTDPYRSTLSTCKRCLRGDEVGPTAPWRDSAEDWRQCGGQTAMSLELFLESRGSASARPGSGLCCFSRVGPRGPYQKSGPHAWDFVSCPGGLSSSGREDSGSVACRGPSWAGTLTISEPPPASIPF